MQGSAMKSGGQLANLNRVFREDLNEKITFKQKLEGGEVANLLDIWGKSLLYREDSAQPLSGTVQCGWRGVMRREEVGGGIREQVMGRRLLQRCL